MFKHASFGGGGERHPSACRSSRTSVDHGTALDLAGSGRADPAALFAAVELAIAMAAGRTHHEAAAPLVGGLSALV